MIAWPNTLFGKQVWTQSSSPWEKRKSGTAVNFAAKRVSLVGFEGLVGGHHSLSIAVAPGLEIGATKAYLGGLAGPGVLGVPSVELYARTAVVDDDAMTRTWYTVAFIVLGILVICMFALSIIIRKMRKQGRFTLITAGKTSTNDMKDIRVDIDG